MKILVTGGSGMLGSEVVKLLKKKNIPFAAPTHAEMDITDEISVNRAFQREQPDAVIHCAAWTKVDDAEEHQAECTLVNGIGTMYVAQAARNCGAKVLYVSTDYVFGDGEPGVSHHPKEPPLPLNVYGMSKYQGELAVRSLVRRSFILRAGWIYSTERPGFFQSIVRKAQAGERLQIVNDQLGTPTWCRDLAAAMVKLVQTENYGIHAAVPAGHCTWYEFAHAILQEKGIRGKISPVTAKEWNAPARRPACSLMTPTIELPDWREALHRAVTAK